jgi:methyl-accepting chemotaxis protein
MEKMNWKNLTIGKMVAFGFGVVLVLLSVVGFLSYIGVGGIVTNAGQVIDGNKLDGILAQKEVDHLNWSNKVNALLTNDKVTTLQVETDDHKCGFGEWLYGEGRKSAERLVPGIASLLKEIEEPHRKLHKSAISIGEVFKQANSEFIICRTGSRSPEMGGESPRRPSTKKRLNRCGNRPGQVYLGEMA